jgi:very-short-patch-repair endonuclease
MFPRGQNSVRGTSRQVEDAARRLRADATPAEAMLWEALRGGRLNGLKFRRQHPVGRFILDFCCPALRLTIEVDGPVHDQQRDHDTARDDTLRGRGYTTLRFRNDEVTANLPHVLATIAVTAAALPPAPGR